MQKIVKQCSKHVQLSDLVASITIQTIYTYLKYKTKHILSTKMVMHASIFHKSTTYVCNKVSHGHGLHMDAVTYMQTYHMPEVPIVYIHVYPVTRFLKA